MTETTDPTTPSSYADAEVELETILRSLEADDVDVDQLQALVARARELITWCRGRLESAEVTITELLAEPGTTDLDPADDADSVED